MVVVFLAYYSAEQYDLLLKLADDRKKIDDKWEDWLVNYIKAKNGLSKEFAIEEFHVDVKKMADYFRSQKMKNTGKTRADYVCTMGEREHKMKSNN